MVNENKRSKQGENNNKLIYFALPILLIVIIVLIVIFANKSPKDYNSFASCLAEKNFVMAGSETCHFCKAQKEMFEGAFEETFIPAGGYKDCAIEKDWCSNNEITGYPTWITPEGIKLVGLQQLRVLEKASGCTLD